MTTRFGPVLGNRFVYITTLGLPQLGLLQQRRHLSTCNYNQDYVHWKPSLKQSDKTRAIENPSSSVMKRGCPATTTTSKPLSNENSANKMARVQDGDCPVAFALPLNKAESDLFQLLLNFIRSTKTETVLRASGGWVRDKLLGRPCSDLDIALSNMTGVEFATKLNE